MNETLTRAEYEALLHRHFGTFAARCFGDLNPQTRLAMNWHLEVIAAKLTAVREGRIKRLIINLPAAASEIADGLDRVPGLVSRARPDGADRRQSAAAGRV